MPSIRPFEPADWPQLWPLLQTTFAGGDTYAWPPGTDEATARAAWITHPLQTWVAFDPGGQLAGTYTLKPNQPGLGSHVCNCGYIVAPAVRGRGVATALCNHSQRAARAAGFTAMQFNLVVSTNAGAVRLWQSLGFAIVGTLPGAFRHATLGEVDAHVMFKRLEG